MGHDRERVRHHIAASLAAAERLHDRVRLPTAIGAGSANVSSSWGDWQAAREFVERGLTLAPRHPIILPVGILLEYQVGDFDQGEAYLKKFEEVTQTAPGPITDAWSAMVIPMVARITGIANRFGIAETAAQAVLSSPSATPLVTTVARIGLALMAGQRADAATAAEQCSARASWRGTHLPAPTLSLPRA